MPASWMSDARSSSISSLTSTMVAPPNGSVIFSSVTRPMMRSRSGSMISPDSTMARAIVESGEIIEPLRDRIIGRVTLEKITDPFGGATIVDVNDEIDEDLASDIQDAGIEKVKIRSVLTCTTRRGVCAKCYGRDLATGKTVELGQAVGVIAAQSIGEPGTQLTMRTFHIGGTA